MKPGKLQEDGMKAPNPEEILTFVDAAALSDWLAANGRTRSVAWLRFFKSNAGIKGIGKQDAIETALCWGWIDGQLAPENERSWLTRFTPRGPRSAWSKRNCDIAERLMAEGRMRSEGLAQVEAAKADGRWARAYDGQGEMRLPEDLVAAIMADPLAKATYETLNRQNLFALTYRVTTAKKPETRARRISNFVAMLARGETLYPNGARK
jgi:uncharacterized protein YdeI (YjbR/CyaY-like superfamily)